MVKPIDILLRLDCKDTNPLPREFFKDSVITYVLTEDVCHIVFYAKKKR
jgi:hypothetical protein